MSSTYQKVIVNRKKKRSRSPQGGQSYSHHTTSVSSPIRSASSPSPCFLSLLKNEEGKGLRGEVHHVWNPNHSKTLALCSTIYQPCSIFICKFIEEEKKNELRVIHTLSGQHERPITSFDWSIADKQCSISTIDNNHRNETDGHIVSCGEDCCIFVWTFDGEEESNVKNCDDKSSKRWTAKRVFTQQNICMTPLHCKWDYSGNFIAIGMGGTQRTASVGICYYENSCWSSRQIGRRKIKSSVLCVAWRPYQDNSSSPPSSMRFVASGGCDNHCKVWCSSTSEINFEQCAEFNGDGWVVAIAWSQSGSKLAFSSQKSYVFIVNCFGDLQYSTPATVINMNNRVMRNILFVDESTLIAGGCDTHKIVQCKVNDEWRIQEEDISFLERCDNARDKEHAPPASFLCIQMISSQFSNQDMQPNYISTSGSDGAFDLWKTTY